MPSILPHAVTPTDPVLEKYIYIYSFTYLFLPLRNSLAISSLSPLSVQYLVLPFISDDVTSFFVSAMQMVHLILAHSLLLDINKSVVSQLPFISVKVTITSYTL